MRQPPLSPMGLPIESETRITTARLTDETTEYAVFENGKLVMHGLGTDDVKGRKRAAVLLKFWFIKKRPPSIGGDRDS